ncbi:MAG: hypothetical protein ACR2RF_05825 [Geminicoccaceae bacterium]
MREVRRQVNVEEGTGLLDNALINEQTGRWLDGDRHGRYGDW